MWLPSNPHVNCRLANLEAFASLHETTIEWFSHRAGRQNKSVVSDCSFRSTIATNGVFLVFVIGVVD